MITKTRKDGKVTIVDIEGSINIGESESKFYNVLEKLINEGNKNILLNFTGVNYIDSTGIGEMIGFLTRLNDQDGKLKLLNPSDRILKILEYARLDTVFEIFKDEAAAIASF